MALTRMVSKQGIKLHLNSKLALKHLQHPTKFNNC